MLMWLLLGVGTAGFFAFMVIRNAEADDKQRKTKRGSVSRDSD